MAIIDQRLKQLDAVVGELGTLLTQWKAAGENMANANIAASHAKRRTHSREKGRIKPIQEVNPKENTHDKPDAFYATNQKQGISS